MQIDLLINGNGDTRARYVSWAPALCQVRVRDPQGAAGPVRVLLRNRAGGQGGQVVFYPALPGAQDSATLDLPVDGTPVAIGIGGKFGSASVADGDAAIEIATANAVIATVPLMVRVRKNANQLTPEERARFVIAFAQLNDRGQGLFATFRAMHTNVTSPEAHGAPGFLPWHRTYLLDLERRLQAIDPSVALPYWRFDQPAPALFTPEFLGVADASGRVRFSQDNPLQFWATDGVLGISRRPLFNTTTANANVISESATLALGTGDNLYAAFATLEDDPHGSAHVSFGGFLSSIPTAARDPLFFLLHANVDRLWAKWQWFFRRFDPADRASFAFPGSAADQGADRIGHNLLDSMWPWNGVVQPPRPNTAPGGGLAPSPTAAGPGPRPIVRDTLDFQGRIAAAARLGFDYDDVPFD